MPIIQNSEVPRLFLPGKTLSIPGPAFGLAVAAYVFYRMIEYPVQLLRKNEVNVIAYLDDLIFWGRSKGEVIQAINLAKETFARLGFIINQRKSVLKPTRIIVWLGLSWETQTFSIGLPRTFRMKLLKYAAKTVTEPQVNRRSLEKLQGLMAFAAQILPMGKFRAHYLPKFIRVMEARDRDTMLRSSPALRKELRWWMVEENLSQVLPGKGSSAQIPSLL